MMTNSIRSGTHPGPVSGNRVSAAQFADLMGAHLDIVWRLASYLSPGRAQAEELVERSAQLGFVRRATLVSPIGFKTWFLGLLLDCWQQAAPRALRRVTNGPEASLGDAYALAEAAGALLQVDPAGTILENLTAEDLCLGLSRLPVEDRVVTALSLADDLTYREIGLILALSADTVRTRLHRGRAELKVVVWQLSQAGT
jgi:RNA polymerase sigma-70 factor, ECF subfamily